MNDPRSASSIASPAPAGDELEPTVAAVEARLNALGDALRGQDPAAIEMHANELHRALANAVARFAQAARAGQIPPALRTRLVSAGGIVAAQRESLARATAALDRAIDVLLPSEPSNVYGAHGNAMRALGGNGSIQA